MIRLLLSFVALLALTSVDALAGEKKLTGPEIKAAFTGATISEKNIYGRFVINFTADGTITVEGITMSWQDEGKWRVEGDKYCRKLNRLTGGIETCFGVTLDGDKPKFWRADGSQYKPDVSFTFTK